MKAKVPSCAENGIFSSSLVIARVNRCSSCSRPSGVPSSCTEFSFKRRTSKAMFRTLKSGGLQRPRGSYVGSRAKHPLKNDEVLLSSSFIFSHSGNRPTIKGLLHFYYNGCSRALD